MLALPPFPADQRLGFSAEYVENGGVGDESISLESDILTPLAGTGRLFVYQTSLWWSQIKTASAALYSNRHYLKLYRDSGVGARGCGGNGYRWTVRYSRWLRTRFYWSCRSP